MDWPTTVFLAFGAGFTLGLVNYVVVKGLKK